MMKLADLNPQWIHPNVFGFLCPDCRDVILTCKDVQMSTEDQIALFEKELPEWFDKAKVVPSNPTTAWKIVTTESGEPTTVTPSINANASGHWHGFITNGEIV